MKTRKALSLFFCTVAFAASAATVSVDTAKLAAGSWALSDASLGVPHGRTVSEATAYDVDGTPGFYAVALKGGGTLFLAADDEIGPVLAFTAESNPDLSAESPLLNLLNRDVKARRGIVEVEAAQIVAASSMSFAATGSSAASAAASLRGDAAQRAKKLWTAFTATSSQLPVRQSGGRIMLGATAEPQEVISDSDIRVEPILTTQWSQTKDLGGSNCYNYYTPNNYPCGCVATAAGQILNKWQCPTEELLQFSEYCTVDDASVLLDSSGPTRVYNWDAMVDKPGFATSEESRQAIGALLSDLGIAFGADYASGGTGAFEYDVPGPLHAHFNYASAYTYTSRYNINNLALHTEPMRQRTILANLDAKRPVELYIMSNAAGGHAVVADGYGYVTIGGEKVEFTHINMGWAGTDDLWYNLPIIVTKEAGATAGQSSGYTFEYLMAATFNIHPTETGDLLTGRITDDGDPVEGATVTVMAAGSTVAITNTTSDARGIYSFCLEGGKEYDVVAVSADGKKSGSLANIFLKKTTISDTISYTTREDDDVGNSWGNDIDIVVPHVRIVGDRDYQNLNDALAAASEMTDPIIEIFGPVRLKKPVTITTNATIRIVPGPSADYPDPTFDDCAISVDADAVTSAGWALQVAEGVRVAFSNVVFTAESGELPYINVLATGSASVAGKIGIGTVKVQDAGGFVIAGAFETVGAVLAVSYAGAVDRYAQFGTYECSKDDASSCAGFIMDALDRSLMGSVDANNLGALVWDRVPVDPSVAIACATNDVIGTTYYLSLDLLFKDYAGGAEVVILKDCDAGAFTAPVTISNSFTIASTGLTFAVTAATDVGFSVTNGAELVFTNVVFARSGSGTRNFVTLNDGSFVLDDGAVIEGLRLAGTAGAVYVNKGIVTMRDGSAITNCVGTINHKGKGSAVYLNGADCSMDFQGGAITGCLAGYSTGAAVYANPGAKVEVSGSASAYGNIAGTDTKTSDVSFSQSSMFTLVGPLSGNIGVSCGTTNGSAFATIGDGVSQDAAKMACGHFFNDKKPKLVAAVSRDGTTLVWATQQTGPQPVPEADAVVRLVLNDASDTYASIGDALKMAGVRDARIELLKDTSLTNSLSIKGPVVLDGMGHTLTRDGNFCLAVTNSTLALTNIVMNGGMGKGRVLDVRDGSLVLEADTVISGVTGTDKDKSMVAPVVVWGGSFVMNPGVRISDCVNKYVRMPSDGLTAGAILINGANAEFRGGTVTRCQASGAGGVYIGNGAQVRIGGDTRILGNELLTGGECNLVVQDKSGLVLADILTGRVGYTEGVSASTNVFGIVDTDFAASTTASNLVVSARRFTNDKTAAKGMVATNETEAILVWSTAVGDSTEFTNVVDNATKVYDVVIVAVDEDEDEPVIVECAPFAFAAIEEISSGKWKLTLTNGIEHCIYTLKCSSDLETWAAVGEPKELSAGDISGTELEFVFEVDDSTGKKFWKVEGANGTK